MRKPPVSVTHPNLVNEWDYEKNGELTPDKVTAGSSKKVWWSCSKGEDHKWEAIINSRTRGNGCPFCSGYRASAAASLARLHPALASQWHPSRNGELRPDQVTPGSAKKVWWKCEKAHDHEWQALIYSRSQGSGCPFCAGFRPSSTDSIATRYPEIAQEWHPEMNGDLTPDKIHPRALQPVWWRCTKDDRHEWQTTPPKRIRSKGCPFCRKKKVALEDSLITKYPELAEQWHPSLNTDLKPHEITPGSNRKVWWRCEHGPDHVWQAQVVSRTSGRGCPYCAGIKVSITNSLATRDPDLASQWHPSLNGGLTAKHVTPGSNRKIWWQCRQGLNHEWQASVASRSNGSGCPFCAGRKVSEAELINKVRPELLAEWHPTRNRNTSPSRISIVSPKLVWWQCPENPDHEYKASPRDRATGESCPECREEKAHTGKHRDKAKKSEELSMA